jgi:hypothetical protein
MSVSTESHEVREGGGSSQPGTHHPPTSVFVAMFFGGLALLAPCVVAREIYAEKQFVATSFALIGEHLGSAIIVAALIGFTYERLVHGHVMASFDAQLRARGEEQQAQLDRMMAGIRGTSSSSVLLLLRDIAEHHDGIPTLYTPVRDRTQEFVLSTHRDFFRALVASPASRSETVESLRSWLDPDSPPALRFLGSDFVGMLRLHELVEPRRDVISAHRAAWRKLTDIEKGCILNYVWAVSRTETPRYQELRQLLIDFDEDFVREWILFVPLQMQDHEFVEMIDDFLVAKGDKVPAAILADAVRALGALYRAGHDVSDVIHQHSTLIEKAKLGDLLRDETTTLPLGQARTGFFHRK